MGSGEKGDAELERQLAELARRIAQLEGRIVELEGRAAAAPQPQAPAPQPQAPAPQPQAPAPPAQWPATPPVNPWGPAERWSEPGTGWGPAAPQPPRSQPGQGWGSAWQPQPRPFQPPQPQQPPQQPQPSRDASESNAPPPRRQGQHSILSVGPTGAAVGPRGAAADAAGTAATRPPARAPQNAAPPGEIGISLSSLRDMESQLTGRLLAWDGGAAVVLGAIFFLSLAFSRGWIGPEMRVAMGLAGGAIAIGLGAWMFGRRQEQLGHVLIAVGLGVVSLALFAGTRLYGIIPPEVALLGSFVTALAVAAIAVRVNSEAVAIYGLVAVVAAPPVMGAPANLTTVAFLGVTLVGTTAIALLRSWRWLPPVAFTITAPQLVAWLIAKPDPAIAVAALGAYWLLHAVAASADELRAPHEEAEARAESLFVANSTLAVFGGLYVLWNSLAAWEGAFVTAAALAHFAFGTYFVWRRGDKYQFGMLINGIGIALVAFAIERQFDGPAVAIGWAAEATVLAAIYGYRKHLPAGGAALVVAGLSLLHLVVYEYPAFHWSFKGSPGPGPFPFADQAGLVLASMVLAGLLAGWLSRSRQILEAISIAGLVVVAFTLPFELSGSALVAGWAAEAVAMVAIGGFRRYPYASVAVALLSVLPVLHLICFEYPGLLWSLKGTSGPGPYPFADSAGVTLGCLLVAGFAGGWLSRSRDIRYGLITAGLLAVAYSLPYELSGPALVAGWAAEAVAIVAIPGLRRYDHARVAIALLALLPISHLVNFEYPVSQWTLIGAVGPGPFPFVDSAGLTLGCLLVAAFAGGWLSRSHDVRCGLTTAGLLAVAYSLPYELTGIALVAGWAALVPASVAAEALLDRLPSVPASRGGLRCRPVTEMMEVHWPDAPLLATAATTFLAGAHLLRFDLPIGGTSTIVLPATPFVDLMTASAAIGIAAFLAAALITARPDLRAGMILLSAALAAYLMVFELAVPFQVVAWCALAVGLGAWSFADKYGRWVHVAGATTLVGVGITAVLWQVVPVERLAVHETVASTGIWFAVHSIVAISATAATLTLGARFLPLERTVRTSMVFLAATGMVYLASALLVDFFQGRVGGTTAVEELQKQAQVSVSILWGVIGMAVFLVGVLGWRQIVREAGLALLALATAKVFIFDLSYLDVAYRVISLMGLGLLLLAGAFVYQSLRPRRPEKDEEAAPAE